MNDEIKDKFSDYFNAYIEKMAKEAEQATCANGFGGWREHNDWNKTSWGKIEEEDISLANFWKSKDKQREEPNPDDVKDEVTDNPANNPLPPAGPSH